MNFRLKRKEALFYTALFSWITLSYLGSTTTFLEYGRFLQLSAHGLKAIIAGCLIFKIMSEKYSNRRLLIYFLLIGITLITYLFINHSEDIFWLVLFSIGTRNINFDKTVKFYIRLSLTYLLLTILLAEIGLIENTIVVTTNVFDGGIINRHLLGFKHVNYLGGYIFSIYCGWLYLKYDKFKAIDIILPIFISVFLYFYVNSKTSAFLILLSLIILLLFKLFSLGRISSKAIKNITYITMSVSIGVSFIASIFFDSFGSQIEIIDNLLSHRIKWGNYFYEVYGFSLFGKKIELISSQQAAVLGVRSAILDNAYMHLIIHYGAITFVILIATYFLVARFSFEQKKYKICLYITIISLCGVTEKWLFMIAYNLLPFTFVPIIDEQIANIRRKKDDERKERANVRTRKVINQDC